MARPGQQAPGPACDLVGFRRRRRPGWRCHRDDRGGDPAQGLNAALRAAPDAPRCAALGDGDCHPTPDPSTATSSHRQRRCWSTWWPCTRWKGCGQGPFGGGRAISSCDAPGQSVAAPTRCASGRTLAAIRPRPSSLRAARANPAGPGRARLPGRPAGGSRRRGAAAAGGVHARHWRQRRHVLDDDVSAFFGTPAAPMLAVAVGVPVNRARPGKRPAQLPLVGLAER